jgi:Z1 domain
MGRWFGYRDGYEDLTRVYTTRTLRKQFQALAVVEEELRRDIAKFEKQKLTPLQVGVKIKQHPGMLVTSPPKMRAAQAVSITYQDQLIETTVFPFEDIDFFKENLQNTKNFLQGLGQPDVTDSVPTWRNVPSSLILEYLQYYKTDPDATTVRTDTISTYITRMNSLDLPELTDWTVAVMSRKTKSGELQTLDLGIAGHEEINLISRSRRKNSESLGKIVSDGDDEIDLPTEEVSRIKQEIKLIKENSIETEEDNLKISEELRKLRSPQEGILMIYPISKFSGYRGTNPNRQAVFESPENGEHIIGLAFIFPPSNSNEATEYITGSVGVTEK